MNKAFENNDHEHDKHKIWLSLEPYKLVATHSINWDIVIVVEKWPTCMCTFWRK